MLGVRGTEGSTALSPSTASAWRLGEGLRAGEAAKRWQNKVGRPEIQGFFGALAGRRATKGVFITTSGFSNEAREYAQQVSDHLVLINGRKLTELMIEHSVGITPKNIRLPQIDRSTRSTATTSTRVDGRTSARNTQGQEAADAAAYVPDAPRMGLAVARCDDEKT